MKIDLPLYSIPSGQRDVVVEAEIVDVAQHLAHVATFAVHENVLCAWVGPSWRISNVETWYCIPDVDADNKELCIRWARAYLLSKTAEDVERAYAKADKECK